MQVACGAFTGPVVGITAAVHGNELNGIPLIHRLFHEIDCGTLCGTLVAIPVVNTLGSPPLASSLEWSSPAKKLTSRTQPNTNQATSTTLADSATEQT